MKKTPLKINERYDYYSYVKRPLRKDYKTEDDYILAKKLYKLNKSLCGIIEIESEKILRKEAKLKNIEIKIGSKIFIERWDGNGGYDSVKVLSIDNSSTRAIIKTNKGYFVFSIYNCQKDNIEFNWTCKGKSWEKKFQKWIDGRKYYIDIK